VSIETQVSVRDEKKHRKRRIEAAQVIKKRAKADTEERGFRRMRGRGWGLMRARGRISWRSGNEQK